MNDTYEQNPDNPTLRRRPSRFSLVLVEGEGFEPSKAEPSDLQSDPFDRSGTPPNETADYPVDIDGLSNHCGYLRDHLRGRLQGDWTATPIESEPEIATPGSLGLDLLLRFSSAK